ncbi:hypothetical protein BKA67DRAFT_191026 [Truncatella angustata]|uniref:BAH domain-containing protein n=1 Tax=Truncatella angustata TaxID=152316 RepID=A0A9P9A221_9PEZI|nr:uncharacterized protein BKA67DRAFT_191026 [Truncatella angustata]KAH6657530.1 hypothetical protein BKA67DRAFT_191026 [Truncatella angustata]
MAASRKRARIEAERAGDEVHAECKYTIQHPDPNWWEKRTDKTTKPPKKQRRSKPKRSESASEVSGSGYIPEHDSKLPLQLSPFTPNGKFYYDPENIMDRHYQVVHEGGQRDWDKLTRYNSFVLHGVKYLSDNYIFVANSASLEQPRPQNNDEPSKVKSKSDEAWVARILEIRASDEHHVYARVYWLYWPDELPPNSTYRDKVVSGRQAYHGQHELIASNHMDIINVVSVTAPATVNQWDEHDEEQVQQALYWRQAWDVRSMELSLVAERCICKEPENPDKTLIRCSNQQCGTWLHDDCLIHQALLETWERLGSNQPHMSSSVKQERDNDALGRLPSPSETDNAHATQPSIAVKPEENNISLAEVESVPSSKVDPEVQEIKFAPRASQSKMGRSKKSTTRRKPYIGHFEAVIKNESGNPPIMEITDVRRDVLGGESKWKEPVNCLKCHDPIR